MIVKVEPAREIHVYEILDHLRDHDREVFDGVEDPSKLLLDEVRRSTKAFVGLLDGEVACLWGIHVKTILADAVYLWMVTTTSVEEHPFVFVRHSQRMAQVILQEYGTIEGHVFLSNPMSAKWLRWLGAELEPSPVEGMLDFRLRRA